MIRFVTDINEDARGIFILRMMREKRAMRIFAVSVSLAVASWVSAAVTLAIYSREVAEFLVGYVR